MYINVLSFSICDGMFNRLIDHLRRDPPPITVSRGKRRMALSYYYKPAGVST